MPLPTLRDRGQGVIFKTFFVYFKKINTFTKPNRTPMNVTQMMSCTTTTALNSQKTSICRGTISIVFYSHFFYYDLSNQSKGGTPSNFILCDSVAKTDTHLSTNNKPPIKSPFAAVYYCYSNSKKDTPLTFVRPKHPKWGC